MAVVTNIDREHLDHYASIEAIRDAFADFVNRVPFYGAAVLCMEDENVQHIFPAVRRRTITYGRSAQVDLEIHDVALAAAASSFRVKRRAEDLGSFVLSVPGVHNVLNADSGNRGGIGNGCILLTRSGKDYRLFRGVDRRFSVRGVERGITVAR